MNTINSATYVMGFSSAAAVIMAIYLLISVEYLSKKFEVMIWKKPKKRG